ncbi:MAG TPA: fluoride efflux transporter CrcB [Solirubrobacteraceae bacterium]|jgi:CrcB protein
MSAWVWAGVALLGGAGAVARFVIDSLISVRSDQALPLGTLIVNVSGAFVLGLLTGLNLMGNTLLLVGTATIGAYTTFSTWMLETHRLAEDRAHRVAVVNVVLSLVAGLVAAALGRAI